MASVKMDPDESDIAYLRERGFERQKDDLNCFLKVSVASPTHGLYDIRRIVGRPWGWAAYRVLKVSGFDSVAATTSWMGPEQFTSPISCYVDAELRGWGADGHTDQEG